jgi:hypothetical protein
MKQTIIFLVHGYQALISPLLPPNQCRFVPTCSTYMIDSVQKHGAIRGVWKGVLRILRCHPFHPGGYDPA